MTNQVFIFFSMLVVAIFVSACGSGGNDSPSVDPQPTPQPSPQPTPAPQPVPEPNKGGKLNCDTGVICEDFEGAALDSEWRVSRGKGEKSLSASQVSEGESAFKFVSNNTLTELPVNLRSSKTLALTFDNNELVDTSGNNHNIIRHNGQFVEGIKGVGLSLNGIDSYVEISHSNRLEVSGQLTASLWYQHEAQLTSNFYSLIEQSANELGGHSRYGIWVVRNSLSACIEPDICTNGGTCQRCVTASQVRMQEGAWYHIASTYDGELLKLYVNGDLAAEESYDRRTGISTLPYPLTLGTDIYDSGNDFLRGVIDEVVIAREASSSSDIAFEFERLGTRNASIRIGLDDYPEVQSQMWGRMQVYLESEENSSNNTPAGSFTFLEVSGMSKDSANVDADTVVKYQYGITGRGTMPTTLVGAYDTSVDKNFDGQSDVSTDCESSGDVKSLPTNQWACVEWHFNAAENQVEYWLDGAKIISIDSQGGICQGSDQAQIWQGPDKFTELRLGVMDTSSEQAHSLYIDDVKVSTSQLGCN